MTGFSAGTPWPTTKVRNAPQTEGLALHLVRRQKSDCCALMRRREDRLRHADDDCENSFMIQGMPQIKGLLFKAVAGSTDNQEQLFL